MALLHAIQLFEGAVTTTASPGTTIYTVAAGKRIIFRMINIRNLNSGTAQQFTVRVNGRAAFAPSTTAGGSSQVANLWIVLMPGDVLQVQAGLAAGGNVIASGSIYDI